MKTNETLLISDSSKRQLTARGYKFLEKIRVLAAKKRGVSRYHSEMKAINDKISEMVIYLIVDKKLTESEIIDIVKKSVKQKQ